jgi:hypothetical protein
MSTRCPKFYHYANSSGTLLTQFQHSLAQFKQYADTILQHLNLILLAERSAELQARLRQRMDGSAGTYSTPYKIDLCSLTQDAILA